MLKVFYNMYEPDGIIIKNGIKFEVPVNNSIAPHYPLPSECDKWITLFKNLRDNFSDDEIEKLNHYCWLGANEGKYYDRPDLGDIYEGKE